MSKSTYWVSLNLWRQMKSSYQPFSRDLELSLACSNSVTICCSWATVSKFGCQICCSTTQSLITAFFLYVICGGSGLRECGFTLAALQMLTLFYCWKNSTETLFLLVAKQIDKPPLWVAMVLVMRCSLCSYPVLVWKGCILTLRSLSIVWGWNLDVDSRHSKKATKIPPVNCMADNSMFIVSWWYKARIGSEENRWTQTAIISW